MKITTTVSIDSELYQKAKASGLSFSKVLNFELEKRLAKGDVKKQIALLDEKKKDIEEQISRLKTISFEQEKKRREEEEKARLERLRRIYEVFRGNVYTKIKNDEAEEDIYAYIEEAKSANPQIADKLTKLEESLKGGLLKAIKESKRIGD